MNRLLLLAMLLSLVSISVAQTQFQKVAGTSSNDRNYHLAASADGSLYACGYTTAGTAGNDALFAKYNRFGELQWANILSSAGNETFWDVIVTGSNHIITTGHSTGTSTSEYGVMIKWNPAGSAVWKKSINKSGGELSLYRAIETSSHHLVAAGLMNEYGHDDIVICKLDSNGNLLWGRKAGSAQADEIMGIMETTQGHYVFAGLSDDQNGYGNTDFAVVKTNANGQVIWKKLYGGTGSERLNSVLEINNAYYFLGWSNSGGIGNNDVILMKTDTAGNISWVKSYGTTQSERVFNMLYDQSQNAILIAGYTDYSDSLSNNRNTFLQKVNPDGDLLWAKSYGSTGTDGHWPTGLARNDDQGYYLLGSTNTFGPGNMSLYLIKTDIDGNTACHQKNPQFSSQTVTGWNSKSFGYDSLLTLNTANITHPISPLSITSSTLCCELYSNAGPDLFICQLDTPVIGTLLVPEYTYQWQHNSSIISSSGLLSLNYGDSGLYLQTSSAANSGCSPRTDSVFVVSDSIPQHGLSSVYEFCPGDSLMLSVNSVYMPVQWYAQPQSILLSSTPSVTLHTFDTIEVWLTTASQCLYTHTISLNPLPLPVKPTITYTANLLESSAADAYQWYYNGLLIQGSIQQTHAPAATGYYHVAVSNSYGCSTPSDSLWVAFPGIENKDAEACIEVFPNPANDQIFIRIKNRSDKSVISLYDLKGTLLQRIEHPVFAAEEIETLRISSYPKGVYYLSVENGFLTMRFKVVVMR